MPWPRAAPDAIIGRMVRLVAIGLVLGACSQPASEPARAAASPPFVIDAAPAPVLPPDAGVASLDATTLATIDASAPSLRACTGLPDRTATSTKARRYTPGDFLGKTMAEIEAELGAPACGGSDAYQWIQPRSCTDWRLYISIWFDSRRATDVVIDDQYTGEHCVYDF